MPSNLLKSFFFLLQRSVVKYPRYGAVFIVATILSGVLDAVGLISLLPLLSIIIPGFAASGGDSDILQEITRSFFEALSLPMTLEIALSLIVVLMVLKGIFMLLSRYLPKWAAATIVRDLRQEVMNNLLVAEWSYFVKNASGRFTNAISSESTRTASAITSLWGMVSVLIQFGIFLAISMAISVEVLIGAGILGGLLWTLLIPAVTLARRGGALETSSMQSLMISLTDKLAGMKALKAMGAEQVVGQYMLADNDKIWKASKSQGLAYALQASLPEPVMAVMLAIGLFLAINYSDVSISNLLIMILFFNRMAGKVTELQKHYQSFRNLESAFWSLDRIISDSADHRDPGEMNGNGAIPENKIISFDSVSFQYSEEQQILDKVCIEFPVNGLVVLSGPSGAGKTTIIDLMIGLLRPHSGRVCVDGIPLGNLDKKMWLSKIGYVPQELVLFNDSIRNNISLRDESLDDSRIESVLKKVKADEFARDLNSEIGEGGSRLSGGQRQRLMLARAMVRDPDLLILDEATTALDKETEMAICDTVKLLSKDRLVVAISHQPYIHSIADRVIRLERGHIVET